MPETQRATSVQERRRLFTSLLDRACRLSELSRKQLAQQLSVSTGTVNAYLLHRVDPLNTRLVIQQRLAALNGLELNEVMALYETGDWDAMPRRAPRLLRHVQKPLRPTRSRLARDLAAEEWRTRDLQPGPGLHARMPVLLPA